MTTLTFRKPSALPGFGLTLGITVAYLSLVVLIPLAATFLKTASLCDSEALSRLVRDFVYRFR